MPITGYERAAGRFDADLMARPVPAAEHPIGMVWLPLLTLEDHPLACIKARNALAVALLDSNCVEGEPWTAILPVSGLRRQIAYHAGCPRHDVDDPRALPPSLRSPAWEKTVGRIEAWAELPSSDRAITLATLNNLTMQPAILRLVESVRAHEYMGAREREMYEIARASYRLSPEHSSGLEMLEVLASRASNPALALQCRILLVSGCLRFRGDTSAASAHARGATDALRALRGIPDWQLALLASRLSRANALLALKVGGPSSSQVRAELRAAREAAEDCASWADTPYLSHIASENRRLVAESGLKLAAYSGHRELVEARVAEVEAVDPLDPELLTQVGDAYVRLGDDEAGAYYYALAGGLGSFAAALAFYKLGTLHESAGRNDHAMLAFSRSSALDPWARSPREALARLAHTAGAQPPGPRTASQL